MIALFRTLDRKARRATINHPAVRLLKREAATVDSQLASGKISAVLAQDLKKILRMRKQLIHLRWQDAHLRGETSATA